MLDFFKKKKKPFHYDQLNDTDKSFLAALAHVLKDKYPLMERQVNACVITGKSEKPVYGKGTYMFTLDGEAWKKLANKNITNFDVFNIGCLNKDKCRETITLFFMEGMIYGYQCSTLIEDLDFSTINIDHTWIKHIQNKDFESIKTFFDKYNADFTSGFMLTNTYKIELDNSEYYVIKELGDGDFLAINLQGQIFELIHDPFGINKVFESVEEMYNSGKY